MGYLLLHSGQPSAKRLLRRVSECTGVEKLDAVTSQDVVIRWGSTASEDDIAAWTLNPRRAIENTSSRSRMMRILKMNGVYTPSLSQEWTSDLARDVALDSAKRVRIERHYRVPVFDLQPLALFRADAKDVWLDSTVNRMQDRFHEVEFDEDVYATRAVRIALRAMRALGLDFGLVTVGITARDRTICLNVTPTPILHGRMLELFDDALQAFITRDMADERDWQKSGLNDRPFRMGTDLEFMLRSQKGRMVLASRYLPRKGRVGCDDLSINQDGSRFPLAELRPDPADTPEELVANIRETLSEAHGMIKSRSVQWIAGSMPFPRYTLGGHIHFSDLAFSSRLVKALDTYVGFPVMMIESAETAVKRRPKYGFLGDIRFKSHGGFEYRTPASWLVAPEVAHAVVALAYVVATHYRDLREDLFLLPKKQRQFYQSDKNELYADFQRIWRQIENTSTYRRYHGALRMIRDMVEQGLDWDESADIKQAWGVDIERVEEAVSVRSEMVPRRSKNRNRGLTAR